MSKVNLTARAVEAAKAREKPYKLTDGEGLYLFVAATGTKSWRANYVDGAKQKTRTYGCWPDVTLAEARKAHRFARAEVRGQSAFAANSPTFGVVAAQEQTPAPVPLAESGHHLYRHFDGSGRLLYVGISLSAVARLADHRKESHWARRIARVTIEAYATRRSAMTAERIAVQREKPLHNIVHARNE